MTKPTVHCILRMPRQALQPGVFALIKPKDHPSNFVSNTTDAITSPVIKVGLSSFETHNTIYIIDKE